jgi:hypothetical protein
MKIELDGIQLDNITEDTGGVSDGRSVSNISTADKRNITSQDAPGASGSSHNDQGRSAVVVSFDGTIFGENAKTLIEQIRSKFKGGEAVPFISDLTGMADITKVIIDNFKVNDSMGSKDRYDYSIVLKEYKEPPEEPSPPGTGAGGGKGGEEEGEKEGEEGAGGEGEKEESEADKEAKKFVEDEAEKSDKGTNTVVGKVLDEEGNPKKGVSVKINGSEDRSVVTDEEGAYKAENLPPGEYTVTVDAEGYEGVEEKFSVGSEGEK